MNTTETTKTAQVQISKKGLTSDIESGMNQAQLMEKYTLSAGTLREILKEAGLKIKKTKVKRFILIDDVIENTQVTTETEQTIN